MLGAGLVWCWCSLIEKPVCVATKRKPYPSTCKLSPALLSCIPNFCFVPLPSLVCSPEDSTSGFVMWLVPYLVWLLPHHLYSVGATRTEYSNLERIYIFGCRQTHSWFGSTNQLGSVLCIGMTVQGRWWGPKFDQGCMWGMITLIQKWGRQLAK